MKDEDFGIKICPIMTRTGINSGDVYCRKDCAVICEIIYKGETFYYCGLMPPDA